MPDHTDVAARFAAALAAEGDSSSAEMLPARLAAAASVALDVDGASLSLLSFDLRVSLGASDAEAGTAERLQFTHGEGPCLDVLSTAAPVRCTLAQMLRTWPAFARDLTATTPFRSVASVPLPFTASRDGGALDLYHRQPEGCLRIDLTEAAVVADRVVDLLVGAQSTSTLAGADDASKVPWLQAPDTRRRMEVWVAIGVLTTHLDLDTPGALVVLRDWAHAHGLDLDTVAAEVAAGRLDPDRLRP